MCGIAGFVGCSDSERARHAVAQMTDDLKRRGPDAQGLECWPGAVLGHRRLSIFDLSDAGRQPMTSDDRSVAVVFNGAIYNFRDIRAELDAAGFPFHSQTDTEVLVNGYLAWGIDALVQRLRGMFAIALWDEREQMLFLLRDRLGVKPLAYVCEGGRLAFASTVRALHRAGFGGDLDSGSVLEFLEFGYVTDSRSIYSDVRKVPAGGLIRFDARSGHLSVEKYWAAPTTLPASQAPTFEEAVEETERRLLESVRLRLSADVKVAALLSGGIDSGLVCWAIREAGADLTAYTVGVPGDASDESSDAAATARHLGIRHETLPFDIDSAPGITDLVQAYGEPFACSSALGMLAVAKLVKANATVLLTGDGGDDVFLGYPEHRHLWMAQQIADTLPRAAFRGWRTVRQLFPGNGALKRARTFGDFVAGGLAGATNVRDGLPGYGTMLTGELQGRNIPQRKIPWPADGGRTALPDFLAYDFNQRFTGEYLPKVDGATMHYALEARSPFLDQEMWSYAASLPFSVRLQGYTLKALLRRIAARRVSPEIAALKKRGFTIPAQKWLVTKWREPFEAAFNNGELERKGWIHSAEIRNRLHSAAATGSAPLQLWYLFVLENWLKSNS
jgi:asparagine synthase (glutamine-hydrolysing)